MQRSTTHKGRGERNTIQRRGGTAAPPLEGADQAAPPNRRGEIQLHSKEGKAAPPTKGPPLPMSVSRILMCTRRCSVDSGRLLLDTPASKECCLGTTHFRVCTVAVVLRTSSSSSTESSTSGCVLFLSGLFLFGHDLDFTHLRMNVSGGPFDSWMVRLVQSPSGSRASVGKVTRCALSMRAGSSHTSRIEQHLRRLFWRQSSTPEHFSRRLHHVLIQGLHLHSRRCQERTPFLHALPMSESCQIPSGACCIQAFVCKCSFHGLGLAFATI